VTEPRPITIAVCVKQVPEVADVALDPATNTLIREGVDAILNPFCEYALDHAVRLKLKLPRVDIVALSMGPPQAKAALQRCLELGADRAVLITDRLFAGADTWATALTLAAAVKVCAPAADLILLGKQAIDGDTAQVGPELAEILNLPQITYAGGLDLTAGRRRVRVTREMDNGMQILEARLPCVVTVSKGERVRRMPSLADMADARRRKVETLTAAQLDLTESELGLRGSYTQVIEVFPPPRKPGGRLLQDLTPDEASAEITRWMQAEGLL